MSLQIIPIALVIGQMKRVTPTQIHAHTLSLTFVQRITNVGFIKLQLKRIPAMHLHVIVLKVTAAQAPNLLHGSPKHHLLLPHHRHIVSDIDTRTHIRVGRNGGSIQIVISVFIENEIFESLAIVAQIGH